MCIRDSGKLKPKEKAEVMDDFKSGRLDALVSTTVIEVGEMCIRDRSSTVRKVYKRLRGLGFGIPEGAKKSPGEVATPWGISHCWR